MNINGNEIVELMFTPMTSDVMIELIDSFGVEQPVLDEQYEMDLSIKLISMNDTGLSLNFQELDGYSQDGEPVLAKISFSYDKKIILPFGLDFDDNYTECVRKLSSKADYINKNLEESKMWLKTDKNGMKYIVSVNFEDENLLLIDSVVVYAFNEDRVGRVLFPNKD
jgi:predicted glycosyltransferase